jgi:hypothetical protein
MHNWMQSTSKIHLETRSHCYSRDLLPRGHHGGCSSTAPEATASWGRPSPAVHNRYCTTNGPATSSNSLSARVTHYSYAFRSVSLTSACPFNLCGIPLRIGLGTLEGTPMAFRTAPFGGAHQLPFLEATTETLKTLTFNIFKAFPAVHLDMGSPTRERGFNRGHREERGNYIARCHRNTHAKPSWTIH